MGGPSHQPEISATDLQQLSASLVKRQRLDAPSWDHRSALLTGRMWVSELEPGMQLRLADIQDRFGLTSQAVLPAGIKIALVIAGNAHVRYGDFEASLGPQATHTGLLVTLPSATNFERRGQAGDDERTLTLSLSPAWAARHGYQAVLTASPDAPQAAYWSPSAGLLALASRLFTLQPTDIGHPAYRLQLVGFAMALAGEALAGAYPSPAMLTSPPSPDRRLARLMSMVDSGQARGVTQAELAHQLGMSLSNLQRRFHHQHGEALGSFLRRHHLSLARDAMAREAMSIETAAALAGYTSATNFATAFKREFGSRPSDHQKASAFTPCQKIVINKALDASL